MTLIASSWKRGNGSEMATGEIPTSSGRSMSWSVTILGSSRYTISFSGSKATCDLVLKLLNFSLMIGLMVKAWAAGRVSTSAMVY